MIPDIQPGPPDPQLLSARDLRVDRGGSTVLDIGSFDVPRGQVTAIVGPNGSGKSTLLLALAHLLPATHGEITYNGLRVGVDISPRAFRRRLAAVFQEPLLLGGSVHDNVALGLRLRRMSRRQARARVQSQLEALGIAELAARKAHTLSAGQAQRTSIARAFATEPEILMLDEPFSTLDAPTRRQLRRDFRALQRQAGTTTLLITHDLGEAHSMADSVTVLDAGRILQTDPPPHLFAAPRSRRVAELLGIENILPGTVAAPGRVRIGERDLHAPGGSLPAGTGVTVCIRADRIRLTRQDDPAASNLLPVRIVDEEGDGTTLTLLCRLEGPRLRPEHPYDLSVDVPMDAHTRNSGGAADAWCLDIEPHGIHLIPEPKHPSGALPPTLADSREARSAG